MVLPPSPCLRPFVAYLWVGERPAGVGREQVLPAGTMHIALRLQGGPVRVYGDPASLHAQQVGDALVAGARASSYWKEMPASTRTVGVQLRPGAAYALFGASAAEFCDRHVALDEVWGSDVARLREALRETRDPRAQLASLEAALLARLRPRALHPGVASALVQIEACPAAERLPAVAGVSPRHFIARFREATGLSPKRYARVCRFRHLLRLMEQAPADPMARLALTAGYSDQSHCNREFLALAGTTPRLWRLRQHAGSPLPSMPGRARSISSKTPA